MRLGLSRILCNFIVKWNVNSFAFRKIFLGFDNANAFLRRLDKNSIIPILKANGASVGNGCDINMPLLFHNCRSFENLTIGDNCHIGKNCFFDLRDKIIIQENVVISMQVTLITHQDLGNSELKSLYPSTSAEINIGRNCYIGVNSTILKGVTLSENSIVAAGSLVNKNVPPSAIVGGVPIKLLKSISQDLK
jgi:acetyltransferase-like isoleucine patch superfamily enzyme